MLYIALGIAVLVLVLANLLARNGKNPWSIPAWGLLGFSALTCGLSPLIALQYLFLALVTFPWMYTSRSPKVYFRLSLLASVAAFAVVSFFIAGGDWRENKKLQEKYPFVSMADRVPEPKSVNRDKPLAESTKDALMAVEKRVDMPGRSAAWAFKEIHEGATNNFVNSNGFGISRRISPLYRILNFELQNKEGGVPQSFPAAPSASEPDEMIGQKPPWDRNGLAELHYQGIFQFSNPNGFGYAKNRNEVAGAKPHRFTEPFSKAGSYQVQNISLVSLLLHEEPVVYVSNDLPSMKEIKTVPTRDLDDFEKKTLDRLYQGEDLVIGAVPSGFRMVGSLRNAHQCQKCHGGERGDLLGAFSYLLDKIETKK
ncbi:MAG: hypothetical protein EXR99_08400 [Gemmataceae bacterium]|nr:hypothetical protein [Gemmataceae bacterium]